MLTANIPPQTQASTHNVNYFWASVAIMIAQPTMHRLAKNSGYRSAFPR
jgi:hypothetical protein